ncbi:hypothetical protein [Brevundimonas sp.]|uniref:hypothetical protein n=1 Tax=Brevundimonas sp. TaxID=1871086 RepID=UPI002E15CA31|nr:hypothetical protein [Brevundimonas sp.]
MPEPSPAGSDARPEIVVCVCDPAVDAALSGASALTLGLASARARKVEGADAEALARDLERQVRDRSCRALLILGRAREGGFRIQTRAENRTLGGKGRFLPTGPGVVRATASAQELMRALTDAGQDAAVSSESDGDAASHLLFRALCDLPDGFDAPAVALLRVPADDPARVGVGIEAAMTAIARHLSPAPRAVAGH